jgi:hypothetical protein
MLMTTGKVSGGAIEVEPGTLPEGTKVTILAMENNGVFELCPEDEARLLDAVAEAERGEVISAVVLLEEIRQS